jgi:hypothetical protein
LSKHESISVSGNKSKGEGLDFVLEGVNKRSNCWVTGMPDAQDWVVIFRNLDKLEFHPDLCKKQR